jgi:hypothetical protein
MMVKFRDLVNPLILNDCNYIGFQGDSEFVDAHGYIRMGCWTYIGATISSEDELTLDDEVDSEILNDHTFMVRNDKGKLCFLQFSFRGDFNE